MILALDNHYETLMENKRWDGNNSVKKIQMELKNNNNNNSGIQQAKFQEGSTASVMKFLTEMLMEASRNVQVDTWVDKPVQPYLRVILLCCQSAPFVLGPVFFDGTCMF